MSDEMKKQNENLFEQNNSSDNTNDVTEEIKEQVISSNDFIYDAQNNHHNIDEAFIPEQTQADSKAEDTVIFEGNADGENAGSSYEWNNGDNYAQENTSVEAKTKKASSGKGFRVFLGITLSVFTVSIVALTIMVAGFINNKNLPEASKLSGGENVTSNQKFDYSSITLDSPNYVAFDFKKYEKGQVLSIPEIAAKCSPSSVGIISEVEVSYSFPSFFFGGTTSGVAQASGSGFIYSDDGYIITNHHVIEDSDNITVILHDGTEYKAELIGSDSLSDIAVLKIEPDEETKLIPMEIGNSDELVVGEPVVAIGCPAGIDFIGTVTDGIVSSINRDVKITDNYGTVQKTMTLIQTNATINHGNSGGPLINSRGQAIGINTLKLSADYEGIGFSIPMNGATPIISQLIEHGEVIERTEEDFAYGKGIIGINGSAISEDEAEYYGIPKGVLVIQIDRNSSAAKAGLRRGDIITHYNGKEVSTVDDINTQKASSRPGTQVTLTVYRDSENNKGENIDITFKLDSQK